MKNKKDSIFKKTVDKHGFREVDYSKFPDGIYCTGCNAVHDQPTKVYVNDNDGVFCKPQIIKLSESGKTTMTDTLRKVINQTFPQTKENMINNSLTDNPYSDLPYWAAQAIENSKILKTIPYIAWALEVPNYSLAEMERLEKELIRLWL